MDFEEQLATLVDDHDFERIVRQRSSFNIFEAVGAIRGELRHSNFLAFLLDPSGSHGLGSKPLLRILRSIISGMSAKNRPLNSLELIMGDLDNAVFYVKKTTSTC